MFRFKAILALFSIILLNSNTATADVNCEATAVTTIPKLECEALVALYNSTNGANWTNKSNWISSAQPCGWYGVNCTSGKVTSVYLHWNNLTGTIPDQIGNLTNLQTLFLRNNVLSGTVPSSIGNLTKLKKLDISINQLTGTLPSSMSNLTLLEHLEIWANKFSGEIPAVIQHLVNLKVLWLGDTFTGPVPSLLWSLPKLEELLFSIHGTSWSLPNEIGNAISLKKLGINGDKLTGPLPSGLQNLTNLEWLGIQGPFDGPFPSFIGEKLTKLQTIKLSTSKMSGTLPANIGNLSALVSLDLRWNEFSGTLPDSLWSLPNLEQLFLDNNNFTGNIAKVGQLTKLTHLSLGANLFTGAIPSTIGNLSQLDSLMLARNGFSGSLPASIGNLTKLKYVHLYNNSFTGAIPSSFENLSNLEVFDVSNTFISGNFPLGILNAPELSLVRTHSSNLNCQYHQNNESYSIPVAQIDRLTSTYPSDVNCIYAAGPTDDNPAGREEDGENEGTPDDLDDRDKDGVSNEEEELFGTSPDDAGSYRLPLPKTLCGEWNGFLGGMLNILEHVNLSSNEIALNTVLYDISGNAQGSVSSTLSAGAQNDVLVHDISGWQRDSYGKACTTHNAQRGEVDGRMVYYKTSDIDPNSFEFAFAMPFANGISGKQFVPFNTFQPSLNPADINNGVANWIQLTNLEDSVQSGKLTFYQMDGSLIESQDVTLQPGSRNDFSGHQFGSSLVGLIAWEPTSQKARFRLRNVRYLYATPGFSGTSFASAFQLEGQRGNGQKVVAPLDTREGSAILEIANVSNKTITVAVQIFNASGDLKLETDISLAAHASHHLITDGLLIAEQGIAIIKGSAAASTLAVAMQYGRDANMSIEYLYGIPAVETMGTTLQGSYNTYLGQNCRLLLTNSSHLSVPLSLEVIRSDGTVVFPNGGTTHPGLQSDIVLAPYGLAEIDICQTDSSDNYGVVKATLEDDMKNLITGTIVRIGKDNSYRFPTPLRH